MKKIAAKSAVKPASPVTKPVAAAKPVAKTAAKPAVKTADKPVAAKKAVKVAPAPAAPVVAAPAAVKAPKKASAPKAKPATVPVTKIVASIDVGFGNVLTVRGEGAGLSWEKGVALTCAEDSKWTIELPSTSPVTFKLLVNDSTWSVGDDFTVAAGESVEITPVF